jgi:hypothetical protein
MVGSSADATAAEMAVSKVQQSADRMAVEMAVLMAHKWVVVMAALRVGLLDVWTVEYLVVL